MAYPLRVCGWAAAARVQWVLLGALVCVDPLPCSPLAALSTSLATAEAQEHHSNPGKNQGRNAATEPVEPHLETAAVPVEHFLDTAVFSVLPQGPGGTGREVSGEGCAERTEREERGAERRRVKRGAERVGPLASAEGLGLESMSELWMNSSTFALLGDSAHNQAMVHWTGQNSSVILILTKLFDFNLGTVTDSSLWRSLDLGRSYEKLNNRLDPGLVLSYLYVCPTNKKKILLVSDPDVDSSVVVSSDEGVSFHRQSISFLIQSLLFHPTQEDWILAYSQEHRLYFSKNFGKTWKLVHESVSPGRFYWYQSTYLLFLQNCCYQLKEDLNSSQTLECHPGALFHIKSYSTNDAMQSCGDTLQ